MNERNINLNQTPKPKKIWQKPEIHILDSYHVNGGADPAIHEGSITHTNPGTIPGLFNLYRTPGSNYTNRNHTKHFYHS